MARRALCLILLLGVLGTACGDDAGDASLDRSLGYLPPDAAVAIAISTDFGGSDYGEVDRKLETLGLPGGLEGQLRQYIEGFSGFLGEGRRLSYDEDVKPILGETAVVGATSPAGFETAEGLLLVLPVRDRGKAQDLLEDYLRLRRDDDAGGLYRYGEGGAGIAAALDGNTLLVGSAATIRSAMDRSEGDRKLDERRFNASLRGLPRGAPIRVHATPGRLLSALPELRRVPWVAALESAGATLDATREGFGLDVRLRTDPAGLDERELPFAGGARRQRLLNRSGELSSATEGQEMTARFLLGAVSAAYPGSRFERRRRAIERRTGVELRDLFSQLTGPAVGAHGFEDEFATRSRLDDPRAFRAALRKLAPRIPSLVGTLEPQALRGPLFLPLRLAVPALPLPANGLLPKTTVERVRGQRDVYRLESNYPIPPNAPEGVRLPPGNSIVFGVIGNAFVVADDLASAREVATERATARAQLEGGVAFEGDGVLAARALREFLPLRVDRVPGLEGLRGSVRTGTRALEIRVELVVR